MSKLEEVTKSVELTIASALSEYRAFKEDSGEDVDNFRGSLWYVQQRLLVDAVMEKLNHIRRDLKIIQDGIAAE